MALKPDGLVCRVREQVIEDLPSGLTLRFRTGNGGMRLVITSRALSVGSREFVFDAEGAFVRAGPAGRV